MRLALLYEHPTWSHDLIGRARQRGIDLTPIDVSRYEFSIGESAPFDLWVNRVNAMPSAGRPASVVASTGHLLLALEHAGRRVINGAHTHRIGGSKLAQAALFSRLGMESPGSILIHHPAQAIAAGDRLGYPVLTKPNVGGSGSGIVRHDTASELRAAVSAGSIDLGIDGTGLVQRVIESADGLIHRVELLGSTLFYATDQPLRADAFNYCAIDGCASDGDAQIRLATPDHAIVDQAAAVMRAAHADVGGVEYIIDAATGRPTYFDFNPYSNFVSGLDHLLGFSPIDRYLDHILTPAVS